MIAAQHISLVERRTFHLNQSHITEHGQVPRRMNYVFYVERPTFSRPSKRATLGYYCHSAQTNTNALLTCIAFLKHY